MSSAQHKKAMAEAMAKAPPRGTKADAREIGVARMSGGTLGKWAGDSNGVEWAVRTSPFETEGITHEAIVQGRGSSLFNGGHRGFRFLSGQPDQVASGGVFLDSAFQHTPRDDPSAGAEQRPRSGCQPIDVRWPLASGGLWICLIRRATQIMVQTSYCLTIRPSNIAIFASNNSGNPRLRSTDTLSNFNLRQAMGTYFRENNLPVHSPIIASAIIKSTPTR